MRVTQVAWQAILQCLTVGQNGQVTPSSSSRSDSFPNVPLVDHFGRSHRFHDDFIAPGNAVIINSMYTTCRGSCPATSAKLVELRRKLWPVFEKQLTILSFTLEPQIDTPKVLKQYAELYGVSKPSDRLCSWLFLTGTQQDIERLRHVLIFYDLNPKVDSDPTQHASLLFYGNSTTDKWAAMPSELPTQALIESIRRIAGLNFEQRYGITPDTSRKAIAQASN